MAKKGKKEKEPAPSGGGGGFFSKAAKAFGAGAAPAPAADVSSSHRDSPPSPSAARFARAHSSALAQPRHSPPSSLFNTGHPLRVRTPTAGAPSPATRTITPNHLFPPQRPPATNPTFDFTGRIPGSPSPPPSANLASAFRTYGKGKAKAGTPPPPPPAPAESDLDASDAGGPWGNGGGGVGRGGHAQEWSGATEQSYEDAQTHQHHHHERGQTTTGTYEDVWGGTPGAEDEDNDDGDDAWDGGARQHPQEWPMSQSQQTSPTRPRATMPPAWPEPQLAEPIPPPRPPSSVWAGANRGAFGVPSTSKPAPIPQPQHQPSAGAWRQPGASTSTWGHPPSSQETSARTSGQWQTPPNTGMPAWGAPAADEERWEQTPKPSAYAPPGGGYTGHYHSNSAPTHAPGGWNRDPRFQPALSRILSVSQASNARAPTEVTSVSRNPPNPKHFSLPVTHERIPSRAFVDRHAPPASKYSLYGDQPYPTPGPYSAGGNPKVGAYGGGGGGPEFSSASERVRAAAARPIPASVPGASKTMAMATGGEELGDRHHPHAPPHPHQARPMSSDGSELEYVEEDTPIAMSAAVLADAQLAFYGKHRMAAQRLFWTLPPDHDQRVMSVLHWIHDRSEVLAALGMQQFLASRNRGALITNVSYRAANVPKQPAFCWISFDKAQPTLDKILQESISSYDPLTTTIVFVFLPSKTRNSVGIWRRKLPMPHNMQAEYGQDVGQLKAELAKRSYIVNVDRIPEGHFQHPDYQRQRAAAAANAANRIAEAGIRSFPPGMLMAGGGGGVPLRDRDVGGGGGGGGGHTLKREPPPPPQAPVQPPPSGRATTRLARASKLPPAAPAPASAPGPTGPPSVSSTKKKWLRWGR